MKINEISENISHTSKRLRDIEREKKVKPGTDDWFKLWFSLPYLKESSGNSYMLQLERDNRAGMLVLHILNKQTGKRTEVRGKLGYETNGYDPEDKLHQLLDKIGKSASVSDLMNGDVVSINPRHPQGPAALKVAHDLANEARSFAPQQTPMQDLVNSYLFFTSFGQMGASDSAKSPDSAEKIKEVTRTLSQSHKNLQNLDKQTLEKNKNKILTHIHDMMNYAIAHFKEHLTPDNFQAKRKQINDILTKYNNLSSTNENIADGKVKYAKPQFDVEWEEAERYPEFVKIGKAAWIELANKGKAVTIKSAKGINNTDAADADSFKSLDKDKQARALAQLKSGNVEMPIVAVYPDGWKELIGGNTRLTAMLAQDGKATVWVFKVPNEVAELAENFADGKKPGRKGLAKRMGVNTKASVSSLRKTAKKSSGEKQRMAHWLANMKAGRQKASETIVEFDEEDEIYYSKKLAPVAKKLFQTMYPEAKVKTVEDGDGYLSIETTDGVFGFSIGVTHQYGDNVISVGNAYAGSYKGVVGQLVKAAAELLQKKHPDGETTLVAQHDVSDNYWPQLANKLGINYENNAW